MSSTDKIITGLSVAAVAGAVVTYAGCVINVSSMKSPSEIGQLKELAGPLKQEIDGIESKMDSMKLLYSFCVHGRVKGYLTKEYLNDVGLQKCNEVAEEYAGLEKELELPLQKYDFLQTRIAKFEKEMRASKYAAVTFLVYGALGSFGMLGLAHLLQIVTQFKRKEESQNKLQNKGEEEKQESKNLPNQ